MSTAELLRAIEQYFSDKSRSAEETKDGLQEAAALCESFAESL